MATVKFYYSDCHLIVIMRYSVIVPLRFLLETHFGSLSPHLSFQGLLVFSVTNFTASLTCSILMHLKCYLRLFDPFLPISTSQSFPDH